MERFYHPWRVTTLMTGSCIGPMLALPLSLVGLFWIYMVTGHAVGQAVALDKEAVLRP